MEFNSRRYSCTIYCSLSLSLSLFERMEHILGEEREKERTRERERENEREVQIKKNQRTMNFFL